MLRKRAARRVPSEGEADGGLNEGGLEGPVEGDGESAHDKPEAKAQGDPCTRMEAVLVTALTVFAATTRFYQLADPSVVVFDEVHFGKFVNGHITGRFYFDIHPPLIKLLIAGLLVATTDYQGDQPFRNISEDMLDTTPVFVFRFVPALAGTLIVPMVCLDNMIVVESRQVLTDTCLLLFFCTALWCHAGAEQSTLHSPGWYKWTALTGLFLGCAISTKWTSMSAFGVVGVSTLIDLVRRIRRNRRCISLHVKDFVTRLVLLLGIPALVYLLAFAVYFHTLPRTGRGDGFMPPDFRAGLGGSMTVYAGQRPSFLTNVINANYRMLTASAAIAQSHPFMSPWYTWPLNRRGIAVWSPKGKSAEEHQVLKKSKHKRSVFMLGNPIVWWTSALALVVSPVVLHGARPVKDGPALPALPPSTPTSRLGHYRRLVLFQLFLGYAGSVAPYAAISRPCFIYHYLLPLLFSHLIFGVVLDVLFAEFRVRWVGKAVTVGVLVGAFAWAFWYFAPLTYAWPILKSHDASRRWLVGWW